MRKIILLILASSFTLCLGCTYYKTVHHEKIFLKKDTQASVVAHISVENARQMHLVVSARENVECRYRELKRYYEPRAVAGGTTYIWRNIDKTVTETCGDSYNFANHEFSVCAGLDKGCRPVGKLDSSGVYNKMMKNIFFTMKDLERPIFVRIKYRDGSILERIEFSQTTTETVKTIEQDLQRRQLVDMKAEEHRERLSNAQNPEVIANSAEVVVEYEWLTDEALLLSLSAKAYLLTDVQLENLLNLPRMKKEYPKVWQMLADEKTRRAEDRLRAEQRRDTDGDGIPDHLDKCPGNRPGDDPNATRETINGHLDEDGCPDEGGVQIVQLATGHIKLLEKVYFEHNKSVILPVSYNLLNQVALTIRANPDLLLIEVQGHAGTDGGKEHNDRLSESRAEAVRQYLIDRGVAPQRLVARYYGFSKPVKRCSSLLTGKERTECEEINRRVEFIILRRSTR